MAGDRSGERFGGFQLLEPLGAGGMGTVYRARELVSGREVALKILHARLSTADRARSRERFRREGELSARLNHPGIVRVHAAGEHEGSPYLAYELVEGAKELSDVVGKLSLPARVALVRDAARAVGQAHEVGVLHRDLKPANLLVDARGRIRVTDFGVALGRDQERLTQTGGFVGTIAYLAPEQFEGKRLDQDPRSDVWSLGVVLYEALTGQRPFDADLPLQAMTQILRLDPKSPRDLEPRVSPALAKTCLRALAKDPDARPADAAQFAHELDLLLVKEGTASSATWVFAPRHGFPTLACFASACVVTLAALLATYQRFSSVSPSEQVEGGPAHDAETATPAPIHSTRSPAAGPEWAALQTEQDATRLQAMAEAWLEAYPTHARRPEVGALLRRARREAPRCVVRDRKDQTCRAVAFLDDARVVAFINGRLRPSGICGDIESGWTVGSEGPRFPLAVARRRGHVLAKDRAKEGYAAFESTTGRRRYTAALPGAVYVIAISPDEETVAVGGNFPGVHLLELETGAPLATLGTQTEVTVLAFSPDGSQLASGSKEVDVAFLSVWTLSEQRGERSHIGAIETVAYAPDGRLFVSDNLNGVRIYRAGELLGLLTPKGTQPGLRPPAAHDRRTTTIAFQPGRIVTVSGNLAEFAVWDSARLEEVHRVRLPGEGMLQEEAFSPSGEWIAVVRGHTRYEVWHSDVLSPPG